LTDVKKIILLIQEENKQEEENEKQSKPLSARQILGLDKKRDKAFEPQKEQTQSKPKVEEKPNRVPLDEVSTSQTFYVKIQKIKINNEEYYILYNTAIDGDKKYFNVFFLLQNRLPGNHNQYLLSDGIV